MFRIIFFLMTLQMLTSCTSVLDATTDKPLQIDPSKRSFGEYLDDRKLRTVITVNINKADPLLDKANVNVHVYNAVVLLTGQVASSELRELAAKTANKVNKVRQVYNELAVDAKAGFFSGAKDSWIASKIKSKLLFDKNIESDRVRVIVENQIVYLMGRLTQAQAQQITETVRTTKGVAKVVRALEYLD